MGDFVTLVEVGPRDGLQNEKITLPVDTRVELIHRLAACGVPVVEAGSFVSPKWVPQMNDSESVLRSLDTGKGTRYPVLVPNMTGLNRASNVVQLKLPCSPRRPRVSANATPTAASNSPLSESKRSPNTPGRQASG